MKKLIITILFLTSLASYSQEVFKRTLKLMGSRFDITVVAKNEEIVN